jgi:predicted TIM-barrel fold metal-dependent hydrolase
MFSTDYPHWDFDDPRRVLPASLIGRERREKIMSANAERYFPFA